RDSARLGPATARISARGGTGDARDSAWTERMARTMSATSGGQGQGYDLTVIGGGPGGYTAAIRAARLGARVAIVERDELGGTCTNWGCIPTKSMQYGAEIYHENKERGAELGIKFSGMEVDVAAPMAHKD